MARRARLAPPPPALPGMNLLGSRGPLGYLLMGGVVLAVVMVMIWRLWSFAHAAPIAPLIGDPGPQRVPAMAQPDLASAKPLPDAAAIAVEAESARASLAATPTLPLWVDATDPFTLAWVDAAEREPAAEPLTTGVWELVNGGIRSGTPVRAIGEVVAVDAGGGGWRRVLIAPEPQRYVEAIARPPLPAIGDRVQVVGRFVGPDELPAAATAGLRPAEPGAPAAGRLPDAEPTTTKLPAIIARSFAPAPTEAPRFAAAPTPDDPLLREVDDERLIVEPRPYDALLDQVRSSPPPADAPSANANAYALHADPAKHRGEAFTVVGTVVRAWEDEHVERDHPFGIARVARVLLHQRDWSPFRAIFGDTRPDQAKRFTKDAGVLTLRLYELAVPGDEPLPAPGTRLVARGRFLKFFARPVAPDPGRPVAVQSDKVYTIFLVASSWTAIDDRLRMTPTSWGLIVAAALFMAVLARWSWRETKEWRALRARLRQAAADRAAAKGGPPRA